MAADARRQLPAGYSEHDVERRLPETHTSSRTDFARDRARLLHSSAFRRLGQKTQVLSPTMGFDDSRTLATSLRRAGYRTGFVGKYLNGYGPQDSLVSGEPSWRYVPRGCN